ncbi:hypothetical protein [Avibacterium sp. 21-599]|uniref:hypothetical protein n=1 Tax=Avibacterium sp. 21-599 TaxID=2911528 RepID=UPI0022454CFB|nr:hypothetical protein [Avibacterium sp. 21-599]MCW9717633.1 hypothetical protein [Avibacterium sp. 21-599]
MKFTVTGTQGMLCDAYFQGLCLKALWDCPYPLNGEYQRTFKDCLGQLWSVSAYSSETRVNSLQVEIRIADKGKVSNERIIGAMWLKPLMN